MGVKDDERGTLSPESLNFPNLWDPALIYHWNADKTHGHRKLVSSIWPSQTTQGLEKPKKSTANWNDTKALLAYADMTSLMVRVTIDKGNNSVLYHTEGQNIQISPLFTASKIFFWQYEFLSSLFQQKHRKE